MAEKYSTDFPVQRDVGPTKSNGFSECGGDVVLVTGTTGALGCYLLAELVENSAISRVYAVNRPALSKNTLRERQEKSLIERGLDADAILDSDKVKLLEADLCVPNFGLGEDQYKEVCSCRFPGITLDI